MSYIEREKTIEELTSIAESSKKLYSGIMTAISQIRHLPEADVSPIKYGYWVANKSPYDKRDSFYYCSVCHRTINLICGDNLDNYPYCHCGAKMIF